ncbi:MAG: low molecular weight protein-tyrosine-phosphatase [Rhodospirillaceae bacterium]
MFKVLFVCTGNICRSPTAEAVFRQMVWQAGLAERITTASAGTHGYHVGEPPDRRSCTAARKLGYHMDELRARKFSPRDFHNFDLLLAMDRSHRNFISRQAPAALADRLHLFLEYTGQSGSLDVPDPYYGGDDGFIKVLNLIEGGCRSLLGAIERINTLKT